MPWAAKCRQTVQQIMHQAKHIVQPASSRAAITKESDKLNAQGETAAISPEGGTALYEGEVGLVMNPVPEPPQLLEFEKQLQALNEVKVLRTVGSRDRGSSIYVHLENPIPLLDMLKEIPVVKEAVGEPRQVRGRGLASVLIHKRQANPSPNREILVTLN